MRLPGGFGFFAIDDLLFSCYYYSMWYEGIWDLPDAEWKRLLTEEVGTVALQTIWEQRVQGCTRCELHKTRTNIVYGSGKSDQPIVAFVGEGPGEEEDKLAEPFVGKSGKLLTKMIEAMDLTRGEVYIVNSVGCRPPGNRNPNPEEIRTCRPILLSQLVAVRPRIIVALGKTAMNALMGTEEKPKAIGFLRGAWHRWRDIPLRATYHPAAMLYNPLLKLDTWKDLQEVMKRLKEPQVPSADPVNGSLF